MSANLVSETNFYIDFEPITFCQLIKKTLYTATSWYDGNGTDVL